MGLRRSADTPAGSPPGSLTGIYVGAVVVLSIVGMLSVIGVLIARPTQDNTAIIATILGFLLPTVSALLAAAVREVKVTIDGRMSELLMLTGRAAHAEGKLSQTNETLSLARSMPAAVPVTGSAAILESIDQNTADIAANTKPTKETP